MRKHGGVLVGCCSLYLALVLSLGCGGGGGGGGGTSPEATGFRVLASDPVDGAYFVALDAELVVRFSEPIYLGKIHDRNFLLFETTSRRPVVGTVRLENSNQTAVLVPGERFLLKTNYEARILAGVESIAGDTLTKDHVFHFTTAITESPAPPPPPPPPSTGSFRAVGDIQVGRSSHRATLLTGGKVLVTAGFATGSTVTDTAELYDPATDEFVLTTGKLGKARGFHSATRLGDGKVLVLGGVAGPNLEETDSAEIYDPAQGTFSSAGKLTKPRAFHTATRLLDGRILILGGSVPGPSGSFSSRTAEVYDPSTGSFTALTDMAVYRATHTATLLNSGKVLIVGGNGSDTRCEIFDPQNGSLTTLSAEIRQPRRGHTATLLANGQVLLMGGETLAARSAEIFDPAMEIFRETTTYPFKERKDHTSTMTSTGLVLLTGGSRVEGLTTFFNRTTELYRPGDGAFLSTGPMLDTPKTRHRATMLLDKSILITGGSNLDYRLPELKNAEVYEAE